MADSAFPLVNEALVAALETISDLPSPPNVAQRIIELGQDPSASLDDVVSVVKNDPALTAKLLRMANSPLYSRQRKTDNLRQALVLFGLNGTLTLALSFSMISGVRTAAGGGLDYSRFWRRSVCTAAAAQALGRALNMGSREEFFLAGLLQDIGMLALDKAAPDLYGSMQSPQWRHDLVVAHERNDLGVDHAEVGAWLLQRWNLPESICFATAASHRIGALNVPEKYLALAECINIGARVADVWLEGGNARERKEAATRADVALGIDRQQLESLLGSVGKALRDTDSLFEVDLTRAERLEQIQNQAKEVLLMRNLVAIQEAQQLRHETEQLTSRTQSLESQVNTDALTGVGSRSYVDKVFTEEFAAARQHDWPLAVAIIDIDRFKEVNDQHGHQNGDAVLHGVAQLLQQICRESDTVGRYGGEEFMVVLPGTHLEGAKIACERMLEGCRGKQHRLSSGQSIVVTVSIGLAVYGEPVEFDDRDSMLRAADESLYEAKAQGRDRLVIYEPG